MSPCLQFFWFPCWKRTWFTVEKEALLQGEQLKNACFEKNWREKWKENTKDHWSCATVPSCNRWWKMNCCCVQLEDRDMEVSRKAGDGGRLVPVIVWSLSRYCADSTLPLVMVSMFPLPAVDIQSCKGNTADWWHQQQPNEELTKDRILRQHWFTLRKQQVQLTPVFTH